MLPDPKKREVEKLINAGGRQVLRAKAATHFLHHDDGDDDDDIDGPEVTHVFTESAYIGEEKVNYYGLAMRRIPVLKGLFLFDLLTSPFETRDTTLSSMVTNHMVDEAKPHWVAHLNVAQQFLNSCFYGNLEGVRYTLKRGVDVNTRDSWDSERARLSGVYSAFARDKTGLMWAVMRKHNTVVELLLGTPGVDINAKDFKEKMTALHMAVPQYETHGNNNPEGMALLLACKNLEVNHNNTLLCAVRSGAMECVQLLLSDPRVDPNMPVGATLKYAVKESNEAALLEPYI